MKFSANIPQDALAFLDAQVESGKYRSRSAAITDAVYLLRDASLRQAYESAFAHSDPAWDTAVSDGLEDENW